MTHEVVNLVESWEVFTQYASDKEGFYQINGVEGRLEIRVFAGRCGFIRQFENATDSLASEILDFCRNHRYIQVTETIRGRKFFK